MCIPPFKIIQKTAKKKNSTEKMEKEQKGSRLEMRIAPNYIYLSYVVHHFILIKMFKIYFTNYSYGYTTNAHTYTDSELSKRGE